MTFYIFHENIFQSLFVFNLKLTIDQKTSVSTHDVVGRLNPPNNLWASPDFFQFFDSSPRP